MLIALCESVALLKKITESISAQPYKAKLDSVLATSPYLSKLKELCDVINVIAVENLTISPILAAKYKTSSIVSADIEPVFQLKTNLLLQKE